MEKRKNCWLISTDKPSRLLKTMPKGNLILAKENTFGSKWENENIYITSDEEIKEGDWILDNLIANKKPIIVTKELLEDGLLKEDKKIILTTYTDLIADGVQAIDDEFLEWFVKNPSCEWVEIKLQHQYHTSKEYYIDAGYVDCTKEQYNSIKSEIPTCPLRILYKIIIPQEEPKNVILGYKTSLIAQKLDKVEIDWLGFPKSTQKQVGYVESKEECTCKEHDPYCCQIHGTCPICVKQAKRMYSEKDMISFAEFVATYTDKNRNVHGQMLHAKSKYDGSERTIDLFGIWFKQFKNK
jgi:hypothetical protein